MNPDARGLGRPALEAAALTLVGAVQTAAFVATWAWWLPLIAAALLAWRLGEAASPRRAAWLGWCYGTAWLSAGTWWLFVSMHRYGHLPAWMAALAVVALAAALSLYLALAAALYRRWRRGRWSDAALFAACWLLAELARGVLLTGFPWVASGYSQVDAPLSALAPWVGVYGIGAALALLAGVLARGIGTTGAARWAAPAAVAAVLVALAIVGPGEFTRPGRTLSVQLLQTDVAQDEKFAAERMPEALAWVAERLFAADADLVVAPETAVALLPRQLDELVPGYWPALTRHFAQGSRAALIGVPLGDPIRGYTNSVVGLSAGPSYRYDKHHLVPFGEFVPPGFRWFTEMMRIPLGDFTRGVPAAPSFAVGGERAAPNICYEDLFGEELARRFVDSDTAPTLFVNVSNIAWFGDTIAIDQHLAISRLRSLEFQRPMLRSTNTGATAAIDHRGQVVARLPSFARGVLDARSQAREGLTPYAHWTARLGLWPLALAAAAVLAAAAFGRSRRAGGNEVGH